MTGAVLVTDELLTCLYGSPDGEFALLTTPRGLIPPPSLVGLTYLGEPNGVVIGLHNAMQRPGRPQVQQTIAEAIGVTQQSISRYLNYSSEPVLTVQGWRALVRLHFEHRAGKGGS